MKNLKNLKTNISKNLDLPEEVLLNIPLINLTGKTKMVIENFKNIYQYSENIIKIKTTCGIIEINGKDLFLKELTKNKISIKGNIESFKFVL